MITHHQVANLINNNLDISYKLLSISKFRVCGEEKIQVHCDRHDCQYSNFFPIKRIEDAISTFMSIKAQYILSELKNKDNIGAIYGLS